jgi:hypothetical protein
VEGCAVVVVAAVVDVEDRIVEASDVVDDPVARCSSSPPQAVKITARPTTDAATGRSDARQRELGESHSTTTPTASNTTLSEEALHCRSWLY